MFCLAVRALACPWVQDHDGRHLTAQRGILAVVALALPGAFIDEWMAAAAGGVAFIAPWLFSYTTYDGAAWTSWIVGLLVVIVALTAVPASM
ncbi:SPW repeat protein [Flindersiella endophytica]